MFFNGFELAIKFFFFDTSNEFFNIKLFAVLALFANFEATVNSPKMALKGNTSFCLVFHNLVNRPFNGQLLFFIYNEFLSCDRTRQYQCLASLGSVACQGPCFKKLSRWPGRGSPCRPHPAPTLIASYATDWCLFCTKLKAYFDFLAADLFEFF